MTDSYDSSDDFGIMGLDLRKHQSFDGMAMAYCS